MGLGTDHRHLLLLPLPAAATAAAAAGIFSLGYVFLSLRGLLLLAGGSGSGSGSGSGTGAEDGSNTKRPGGVTGGVTKSPFDTLIPGLTPEEVAALPYPPDALPGGRQVETPYGRMRVYEWGPGGEGEDDGIGAKKVLLVPGIGTPVIALGGLASELVRRGFRVMMFDLFGRGYSDNPNGVDHDAALYASQMLLALASSRVPWTGSPGSGAGGEGGFYLLGYSLGGGLAVSFARYFPHALRGLALVAPGGLIRAEHVSWRSRLLYSRGVLPRGLLEWVVRRRLEPRAPVSVATKEGGVGRVVPAGGGEMAAVPTATASSNSNNSNNKKLGDNRDASGGDSFDNAPIISSGTQRPVTVASVMAWQLRHHAGFVPAFMSGIRHAPIYGQTGLWREAGRRLAEEWHRPSSSVSGEELGGDGNNNNNDKENDRREEEKEKKVVLILGRTDPVVVMEEMVPDAEAALGDSVGLEIAVLEGGHEVAFTHGADIAELLAERWAA